MPRKPAESLELLAKERQELEAWARQGKTGQTLSRRARIVLACAKGAALQAIAVQLNVTVQTVAKWRKRFIRMRLDGLVDAPRSGAPKTIDAERVDAILARTLDSPPANGLYWTSRSLAQAMGEAPATIFRIWRTFGLRPKQQSQSGLTGNPAFMARLRDLVGIHIDPPVRALALCMEVDPEVNTAKRKPISKSAPTPVQLAGNGKQRTFHLTNLLGIACSRLGSQNPRPSRYNVALLDFLKRVDRHVPKSQSIHLILEHREARLSQAIQVWLLKHPRIRVTHMPSLAAWLYQWKRVLEQLSAMEARLGGHHPTMQIEKVLDQAVQSTATDAVGMVGWVKSMDDIKITMTRYQMRIIET